MPGQDQSRTEPDQLRPVAGIVLDVDGTLLDPDHRLSPANAAAGARARAAGLHVLLASGRSARALLPVVAALELDGPVIAFNGALTFRVADGAVESLDGTPLDRELAAGALRLAREHGIEAGWFELGGWRVRVLGPGAVEEAGLTDEPPTVSPDLPDGAAPPYKLMCIAVTRAETAALHALRDRLPDTVAASFSHERYLEITAPGTDKAHAVRAAAAGLGLAPSDLAAIGDAENDVAMLRAAGVGIAMGNASAPVLAATAHRTAANDRDGVARAIDALLAAR
jgi:Cof subfamily protein (haloacid dehalogenase superfamily)